MPFSRVQPPTDPAKLLALRRAFLQITDEDCVRVRALAARFQEHAQEFVTHFYAHLRAFPQTAALLEDEATVERLKGLQLRYFKSLLQADHNAEYVANRRRIGQAHAEAGVEPQWFLGAFNLYVQQCTQGLTTLPPEEVEAYTAAVRSLLKLILLDVGLTLDAYWERLMEQLRQALDLYAQSNAELREFAHLASHDLKTPLATVSGLCEEFLDEFGNQVPGEGRGLIEGARQRTLKLKGMIDDLLAASEAAAQPTQRSWVSTRMILDEVLARIRLEFADQLVRIEAPDELPEVYAHGGRLREVFYHLLANAVKFMDKPDGRIRVSADRAGAEVIFCIEDNGPGISAADLPTIFAPFRRLPQHRHLPGTGLGLYFVRKIVEEQGGRIWAESAVGQGSRFYVALPAGPV
jgi:signal transduction histidine kinase